MNEATLILKNMRGGCATVEGKVHTLFRFEGHRVTKNADDRTSASKAGADHTSAPAS